MHAEAMTFHKEVFNNFQEIYQNINALKVNDFTCYYKL